MENIMTNAWSIARKGQKNYGGKIKEYFAKSLKMAWAIFKKGGNKMNGVKGLIVEHNLPTLQGSAKQIEWAMKIRNEASATIMHEVTHELYREGMPKRPVTGLVDALQTEESVEEYLKGLSEGATKRTVESMNDLLDRYERAMEIATNPSAKFWIDNRGNQEANYKFLKFAEYVQAGVKNF